MITTTRIDTAYLIYKMNTDDLISWFEGVEVDAKGRYKDDICVIRAAVLRMQQLADSDSSNKEKLVKACGQLPLVRPFVGSKYR